MSWEAFKDEVESIVEEYETVSTDDVVAVSSRSANPTYGALKHLSWENRINRIDSDIWEKL